MLENTTTAGTTTTRLNANTIRYVKLFLLAQVVNQVDRVMTSFPLCAQTLSLPW
jgi:hypothetical protein